MADNGAPKRSLRPKPNYLLTIVSISMVLLLLGIFSVVILHSRHVVKLFKEQINVIVELHEPLSEGERVSLFKHVHAIEGVKAESAIYTSSEEAYEELKSNMGEDLLLADMENPLFNIFTFNVEEVYLHKDSLDDIKEKMLKLDNRISDVYFQETYIEEVAKNLENIGYVFLVVALLLSIIVLTLIHNTIKLGLYNDRLIIKNMELAGASINFISWPYTRRAVFHGFLSAVLAILVLIGIFYLLVKNFEGSETILNREYIYLTFAGMIFIGVFINALSTFVVVRKYLRMRSDDLF